MFDVEAVRRDFPILKQKVRGKPLVYLDNAASSQKPVQVLDAERRYYEEKHSNVHRGVHTLAERATQAFEEGREKVARFVGASPEEIIWTRGTTEGINLVAYAWARRNLRPGDEILLTVMEHHSNLVPWQLAAKDTGARIRYVPMREDYTLDLDAMEPLLTRATRLVAVAHVSNVLGTVNPVREIANRAHAVGARVLVDAAQSVPHQSVDVKALDCDWLVFSSHKMLGPTGIGALYGKLDLLEAMPPFHGGGEMILEVSLDGSTYKAPPHRFEAGTPGIAGAVGMGAAVDYLTALGMDAVHAYEEEITRYALEVLGRTSGVKIFGPMKERGGAVSFAVEGVHAHDLATVLDTEGVAVRAGHHCAQPLMRILGVPATARASFYVYNTRAEVDALASALEKAKGIFRKSGQPA